jgi:hypothetical protein
MEMTGLAPLFEGVVARPGAKFGESVQFTWLGKGLEVKLGDPGN